MQADGGGSRYLKGSSIKRGETSHHKMLELDISQAAYDAWYEALPRV